MEAEKFHKFKAGCIALLINWIQENDGRMLPVHIKLKIVLCLNLLDYKSSPNWRNSLPEFKATIQFHKKVTVMSLANERCPNICFCCFGNLFININKNTHKYLCQNYIHPISDMNWVLLNCILSKHFFQRLFLWKHCRIAVTD